MLSEVLNLRIQVIYPRLAFMATIDDLRALSEEDLTTNVVIPLLKEMGFTDVRYVHGADEHGKDVVFWWEDQFHNKKWKCAQVKAKKIHGSSATEGNVSELRDQIQDSFATPYINPADGRTEEMTEVYIITSHNITSNAKKAIWNLLDSTFPHHDIHFIDGQQLLNLAEEYGVSVPNREIPDPLIRDAIKEGKLDGFELEDGRRVEIGIAEPEEVPENED